MAGSAIEMREIGIEKRLRNGAKHLYDRYSVLKNRLFTKEYMFVMSKFSGGNDHGPLHIQRVLENLDRLLGKTIVPEYLSYYELFLTMMAILYHDVGILRQRKEHASLSGIFLKREETKYIFHEHDRDIIVAAVVSHSSSKDIETETKRFGEEEAIGGQIVRPRVIAALVRFADELDEDSRRSDPNVANFLDLPEDSQFYWRFNQRILGLQPRLSRRDILINVEFKLEDAGLAFTVDGERRPFLALFAEKLAKLNRERVTVNRFLPEELRYDSLNIQVRPLENHDKWKNPRQFVFNNYTSASEFVAAFPELLLDPAKRWLEETLEAIRLYELKVADAKLQQLFDVNVELPALIRLRVFYAKASLESIRAEKIPPSNANRKQILKRALDNLKIWWQIGLEGGFRDMGETPRNRVLLMGRDEDLRCVLKERLGQIRKIIGKEFETALPSELFSRPSRKPSDKTSKKAPKKFSGRSSTQYGSWNKGGNGNMGVDEKKEWRGGGCIPIGTNVQTPTGNVPIENLQEGSEILSIDIEGGEGVITTRVVKVYVGHEKFCIRLNQKFVFTPSQPLYESQRGWMPAAELTPGMNVLDKEMDSHPISQVELVEENMDVYTLATDHPSHNYIAYGLVCANKVPSLPPDDFS